MTAENSSSTAATGRELWSLREDVSLEGDPFRDPVRLRGRWGDITIPRSSRLVRETLYRMGLGPISLENATSAAAMPAGGTYRDADAAGGPRGVVPPEASEVRAQVMELHSVLERLQPLIVRSLAEESGQPLLSVVPLTMRSRFYPVPLTAEAPFRLSVYACLRADGREYSIESPLSLHRVVLHRAAAMRLIAPLARPITPAAFTAALSLAEPAAARVLEYLAAAGMVVGAQGAGTTSAFAEDLDTAVVGWSPVEMMFHTRSTLGRHDHNFGVTYPAGTTRPVEPVVKPQASRHIPLHRPRWEDLCRSDPPVVVAMEGRRSARRYAGSPITAAQLGDLLYRTARVRSLITAASGGKDPPDVLASGTPYSNRPYPSGGACYELELYLTVGNCMGLANGVYHYDPLGHRLEPVSADRAAADELLSAARMTAALESPAQVLISMTARFRRLSWRYEGLAYRLVLMHVGVLMQNLYIVCAAMGLAPCALDAVDVDVAARAFGIDWRTEPCVGQFVVGGKPDVDEPHRTDRVHLSRILLNMPPFLDGIDLRCHDDLMEANWAGRLRCRIFLPDQSEVTFERRGFTAPDKTRQANLEKVGSKFLEGFEYGMTGQSLADIESSLETVEPAFRGFAYEGCTMALTVRDGIRPYGQHWVRDLLASRGANHIYMAYVGVGWAMARLPRLRWRAIQPHDPLLRWLALDGYGFHQAYFRTQQYVWSQHQARIPGWEPAGYAGRVVDQGIGRALWFVNGSDVRRVATTIEAFPQSRRGDLWSGAALASVYAGGADAGELSDMARLAGQYRSHAAQGAAFAAKARLLAGLVMPGTELGVKVYCDMSVEEAAAVTDEARDGLPSDEADMPRYEMWRDRIRKRFE
jgi:SagB-type dehydrogenase family enzyme